MRYLTYFVKYILALFVSVNHLSEPSSEGFDGLDRSVLGVHSSRFGTASSNPLSHEAVEVILRVSFRRSKRFHWDNSNENRLAVGPSGVSWAASLGPKLLIQGGAIPNQYVVDGRDELGFAVNVQRKNRKSHLSQRNGLTNIIARILSMIPLRLD